MITRLSFITSREHVIDLDTPRAYPNTMKNQSVTPVNAALALAQTLIRCRSVTPMEAGALGVLESALQAAGFDVTRLIFSQEGTADVENLYARWGHSAPVLAFAGHVDVVPPGDPSAWSVDPFGGNIVGNRLIGRGATDMKGGIAAFVAAALAYIDKAAAGAGSIAFLITGDEEGPSINGTAKLLAWAKQRGEIFDHCIVGEPTSREVVGDTIKIGRRGSLSAILTVEGLQGHVAYPHLADNPIPLLTKMLSALLSPLDDGTTWFQASNLEIVGVESGAGAFNIIPARALARINIRLNDLWTLQTLEEELRQRIDNAVPGANVLLELVPGNSQAFLTEPGPFLEAVAEAVFSVTGQKPDYSTSGGTSDARFIKDYCPVIELGLVGKTMHKIDEEVALADLESLTNIYLAILNAYFASPRED